MSNSAALYVHRAISFASVVGFMRENTAVAPITSVRIPVGFVGVILDYAVYGTMTHVSSFSCCWLLKEV
jgi:hypothetical protein